MRRTIVTRAIIGVLAAALALAVGTVVLPAGAGNPPDPGHTHGNGHGPGHSHGNGLAPGHSHGNGDKAEDPGRGPGPPGPPGHVLPWRGGQLWVTAAETLGLEPGQLRQRLRAGETLGEVADERGVDREVLVAALLEVHEEQLTELLDQQFPGPPGPPFWLKDDRVDDGG